MATKCFALSKEQKLRNSSDFKRSRRDHFIKKQHFFLVVKPNEGQGPRLGMAVSKKNVAKAVHRVRVKRVVRESFRLHQHQMNSVDIVIIARQGISQLPRHILRKMVDEQWCQLPL